MRSIFAFRAEHVALDQEVHRCRAHPLVRYNRAAMQTRPVDWHDYIVSDPHLCHGQACIKGTRIPVAVILDNLAAGVSEAELLQSYPSLTPEAIRASLAYAADLAREQLLPLTG